MSSVRPPAVAGAFYPSDPAALREMVDHLLDEAPRANGGTPRAVITPHAGYVYSGPVAASAFRRIAGAPLTRAAVIGPSHHVAFSGVAAPRAGGFRTPLGEILVDHGAIAAIPGILLADEPHRREHAIEVELPFLQRALGHGFALLPLVVGDAGDEEVAAVLEPFADDPATLVVISSDLSHFLDHASAIRRDRATAEAIERFDGAAIGAYDACGFRPIRGWLALARRRGLSAERLDLRNSGDTAGDRRSVVGYGAWAFSPRGDGQSGSATGASSAKRSPGPGLSA